MNKETQAIRNDLVQLAEDARALLAVTVDVAGVKAAEARKRLETTLDRGKEIYGRAHDKAIASARTANAAVREHPYEAIALSLGIGLIIGCLVSRRSSKRS